MFIPELTATGSKEFSRSMTGSSVISEAILSAICNISSPNSPPPLGGGAAGSLATGGGTTGRAVTQKKTNQGVS